MKNYSFDTFQFCKYIKFFTSGVHLFCNVQYVYGPIFGRHNFQKSKLTEFQNFHLALRNRHRLQNSKCLCFFQYPKPWLDEDLLLLKHTLDHNLKSKNRQINEMFGSDNVLKGILKSLIKIQILCILISHLKLWVIIINSELVKNCFNSDIIVKTEKTLDFWNFGLYSNLLPKIFLILILLNSYPRLEINFP